MGDLERLRGAPLPFATLLGMRFTGASKERVTTEAGRLVTLVTQTQLVIEGVAG